MNFSLKENKERKRSFTSTLTLISKKTHNILLDATLNDRERQQTLNNVVLIGNNLMHKNSASLLFEVDTFKHSQSCNKIADRKIFLIRHIIA